MCGFSVSEIVPFINDTFVKEDGTLGYNYSGAYTPILGVEHLTLIYQHFTLTVFFQRRYMLMISLWA